MGRRTTGSEVRAARDARDARDAREARGPWWALVLAAVTLAGCAQHPHATTAPAPRSEAAEAALAATTRPSFVYQEVLPGQAVAPGDALRVLVEVIRISAPAGSLSGSPGFWQVTSDRMLTPEKQRFLAANNLRFATLEASTWPSLKAEIDRHAGVMSQTIMVKGTGRTELDIRTTPSQTLFYFDDAGRLNGRSFEDSYNFWGLRFAPDPAEPGKIALDLCPVVRDTRRQTRVTRRNNEYEVDYSQPEAIYQLGMQLRLPLGMALLVAPTPSVLTESNSLGRAFLTADDPAGLLEYVLVLYPHLYRLNVKATQQQFEYALQREQQQRGLVGEERPADPPSSKSK